LRRAPYLNAPYATAENDGVTMHEVGLSWSATELRALAEARSRLGRRVRINIAIGLFGVVATIGSFAVLPAGGVLFYGALIAGPLYAIDAHRKLQRVETLRPGTPLNAKVLGIATFLDPPRRDNRVAIAVIGVVILGLLGFIVVALTLK
jgi:hypothetical protein